MNLFYHPSIPDTNASIVFDKDESRHMTKVLRKKEGDLVHITNGKGEIIKATLSFVSDKKIEASILEREMQPPLPYELHMAVAPTKNNDRFEWFLEKATEIGIHSITPILCEHSERRVIKADRFERILESAMKQSLSAYKPILHPLVDFSEYVQKQKDDTYLKCIAHCEAGEKSYLHHIVAPKKKVLILIGPEGDFSYNEIQLAKRYNFEEITLGTARLRTETAAITACNHVSFINQPGN